MQKSFEKNFTRFAANSETGKTIFALRYKKRAINGTDFTNCREDGQIRLFLRPLIAAHLRAMFSWHGK